MIKWEGLDENGDAWDDTWEPVENIDKDYTFPLPLVRFCLKMFDEEGIVLRPLLREEFREINYSLNKRIEM